MWTWVSDDAGEHLYLFNCQMGAEIGRDVGDQRGGLVQFRVTPGVDGADLPGEQFQGSELGVQVGVVGGLHIRGQLGAPAPAPPGGDVIGHRVQGAISLGYL